VAAIALTLRDRKDTKSQNPAEQVKVKRADRIRMVSMASEHEVPEQNSDEQRKDSGKERA
jgi:NADH-quinone oxidoreductase subunit J